MTTTADKDSLVLASLPLGLLLETREHEYALVLPDAEQPGWVKDPTQVSPNFGTLAEVADWVAEGVAVGVILEVGDWVAVGVSVGVIVALDGGVSVAVGEMVGESVAVGV